MIKENNTLIADKGKYLMFRGNLYETLNIGSRFIYENDEVKLIDVPESEVTEVYPVLIFNDVYYISSTKYEDIVTELIRKKYSLDAELALIANSRLDNSDKKAEQAFQEWRAVCKKVAKKLVNE